MLSSNRTRMESIGLSLKTGRSQIIGTQGRMMLATSQVLEADGDARGRIQ
jgi:hypothetical protein